MVNHHWNGKHPANTACQDDFIGVETVPFVSVEEWQAVSCPGCLKKRPVVTENLGGLYDDPVNHPSHYTQYPVEVIEITERLSFLMGNVVKYVLRADHKGRPLEDLKKARWYLDREINRRTTKLDSTEGTT